MQIQELWSKGDEQQLNDFGRFVATDDLPGALFSLGAASAAERAQGRALLRDMGARLAESASLGDSRKQADALCGVLAGELGFALDETPSEEAIALHRALARRKGHAAILASIYREVASAGGLSAEIVASPGRLLLRIGREAPILVDPALGRAVGPEEAALPSKTGLASDLSQVGEATVAEVVGRALKVAVAQRATAGDLVGLYRYLGFAAVLRPERPLPRLQRAAVAEQLGARSLAEAAYRAVAHDFPNTEESAIAASKLREARAPRMVQ